MGWRRPRFGSTAAEGGPVSDRHPAPPADVVPARHQWRRRPVLSLLLRVAVVAAPVVFGVSTSLGLGRLLPQPHTILLTVLWYAGISVATLVVIVAVERAAHRLLPLAALLNLSLLFPDQAPKRFAVARRV